MKNSTTMRRVGVAVAMLVLPFQLNRVVHPGIKPGFLNNYVFRRYGGLNFLRNINLKNQMTTIRQNRHSVAIS